MSSKNTSCSSYRNQSEESNKMFDSVAAIYEGGKDALIRDLGATTETEARDAFVSLYESSDHSVENEDKNIAADIKNTAIASKEAEKLHSRAITNTPISILVRKFYNNDAVLPYCEEIVEQLCTTFSSMLDEYCDPKKHPEHAGKSRAEILHELHKKEPRFITDKMYSKELDKAIEELKNNPGQSDDTIQKIAALNSLRIPDVWEGAVQLMYRKLQDIERINMGAVNTKAFQKFLARASAVDFFSKEIEGYTRVLSAFNTRVEYWSSIKKNKDRESVPFSVIEDAVEEDLLALLKEGKLSFTKRSYYKDYTYESASYLKNKDRLDEVVDDYLVEKAKKLAKETGYELDEEEYKQTIDEKDREKRKKFLQKRGTVKAHEIISDEEVIQRLLSSAESMRVFNIVLSGNNASITLTVPFRHDGAGTEEDPSFSGEATLELTGKEAKALIKKLHPELYTRPEEELSEDTLNEGDTEDTSEDEVQEHSEDDESSEMGTEEYEDDEDEDELTSLEESSLERWMEKADTKTVREGIASQVRRLFMRTVSLAERGILGVPRTFSFNNMYIQMSELRDETRASNSSDFFDAIRERANRSIKEGDTDRNSFNYFCRCLIHQLQTDTFRTTAEKMSLITLMFENFDKASTGYTTVSTVQVDANTSNISLQDARNIGTILFNSYHEYVLLNAASSKSGIFNTKGNIKINKAKALKEFLDKSEWNDSTKEYQDLIEQYKEYYTQGQRSAINGQINELKREYEATTDPSKKEELSEKINALEEEKKALYNSVEAFAKLKAIEEHRKEVLLRIRESLMLNKFISLEAINELASSDNKSSYDKFIKEAQEFISVFANSDLETAEYFSDSVSVKTKTQYYKQTLDLFARLNSVIRLQNASGEIRTERNTHFGKSNYNGLSQHSMVTKQLDTIASLLRGGDRDKLKKYIEDTFLKDEFIASKIINEDTGEILGYSIYNEWIRELYSWATGELNIQTPFIMALETGNITRGLGFTKNYVQFTEFTSRENMIFNFMHFLDTYHESGMQSMLIPAFILGDSGSVRYLPTTTFQSESHIMRSYLRSLLAEIKAYKCVVSMNQWCEESGIEKIPYSTKDGKLNSFFFPKFSEKIKDKTEEEIEAIIKTIEDAIKGSELYLDKKSDIKERMLMNSDEAKYARAVLSQVFREYVTEDIEAQYKLFKDMLTEAGLVKDDASGLDYKAFPITDKYRYNFEAKTRLEDGVLEGINDMTHLKDLSHLGTTDNWLFFMFLNFKFGEMQHIHLTCGTPSFYRDVEDMQKRWKSWFATGAHLDSEAVDPSRFLTAEQAEQMSEEALRKYYVKNPLYDLTEEGKNQPKYFLKVCPSYSQRVGYFQDIRECTTAKTDKKGRLVDSEGNTLTITVTVDEGNKKEAEAKALEKANELAVRTDLGKSLISRGVPTHQYELFKPIEVEREKLPDGKVKISYQISTKGSSITDGQAYRSLDSYRQIQIMLGEWNNNPNNEKFYNIIRRIRDFESKGIKVFENGKLTENSELRALYEEAMSLNFIPQPVKPLYAGYEDIETEHGVIRVPVFHKYSERILIPELIPEGQDKMLGYAMHDLKWDMIASTECVKVGRFGQAAILDFSSQEALNESLNSESTAANGESKIYAHTLSYDGYKKQSNIPYKMNHETIVGTQSRKINGYTNLGNGDESFECSILGEDKDDTRGLNSVGEGSDPNTITLMSNGKEKIQIHRNSEGKFSGKDMMRLVNCLLAGNWISSYRDTRSSYTRRNKLRRLLEKSAIRDTRMSDMELQSYDDVVRNLLGNKVRDFRIPLSEGLAYSDIVAHLLSFFKKQVIKQWSSGGSAVQISPLGSDLKMKIDANGNIIYTQAAQTFDYSYIDENGQEVKLNYLDYVDPVTGRLLKEVEKRDAEGNVIIGKDGKPVMETVVCSEEMDDELNSKLNKEFPGILDSLAVRIPTEKLYSTIHMRSVKFYPPCAGGIVAVSSAYTTIAGFDFDIDKLYIKRFSFVKHAKHKELTDDVKLAIWNRIYEEGRDEDGVLYKEKLDRAKEKAIMDVRHSPDLTPEEKEEKIRVLNDVNLTHLNKFWDEAGIKHEKKKVFNGIMRKLGYGLTPAERRYIAKYGEWEGYHDGNIPIFNLDPVVRDNMLLAIMLDRLHEEGTFKERYTPGNFCYIEEATPAMKRVTDGVFVDNNGKVITDYKQFISMPYKPQNPDPSNPSTIFHYQVNNNIYDREIGICAVQNIKQVLLAMCFKCRVGDNDRDRDVDPILFGTMIDRKTDPRFKGIGVDYLLSRVTHGLEDGNDAGLNLSQMLDASVDAIKQATLEYFGVNPETSTYVTSLLALGAKWEDIGMLLNQPIIREAVRLQESDPKYKGNFERALERAFEMMATSVGGDAQYEPRSLKDYAENRSFELTSQVLYNSILSYSGYNSDGTETAEGPKGYRAHKAYAQRVKDEGFLNTQAQVVHLMKRVITQASALNEITTALRPDNANAYGIKISSCEDLLKSANMLKHKLQVRKMYFNEGISPEGEQSVFPIDFQLDENGLEDIFGILDVQLFNDKGKLNMDTVERIINSPLGIAYTLLSITQDYLQCLTPYFSQLSEPFKAFKEALHEMTKKRVASPTVTAAVDDDLVSMLIIRIANNSYLREQLHLDSMFDPNFVHTVLTQSGKGLVKEENVTSRELALIHLPQLLKKLSDEDKSQYAILNAIKVKWGVNGRPYLSFANMGRLDGTEKAKIGRSWEALISPANPNKYLQQIGRLLFFHCLYTRGMGAYSQSNANAWMDVIIKEAIPGYLDATALTRYLKVIDNKIVCPLSKDFDPENPSTYEEVADINEMLKVFLINNAFGNNRWWQLCANLTSESGEIYRNMIKGSNSAEAMAIGMEYQPALLTINKTKDENGRLVETPLKKGSIVVKVPIKGTDKLKLDFKVVEEKDSRGNTITKRYVKVPPIIKLEARNTWDAYSKDGIEKRERYFVLKDLTKGNWVPEYQFVGLTSKDMNFIYVEYELMAEGTDEFIKDMTILDEENPRLMGSNQLQGELVSFANRQVMMDNLTEIQRAQLNVLSEIFFGSKAPQSNAKPKALIVFDLETNGLLDGQNGVENDPERRIQIAEFSAESVIKTYDEAGNGKTQDISEDNIKEGKLQGYMPTMDVFLDMYSPNGTREMPPKELRKGVANPLYDVYKDAMEHRNEDTFDSRILLRNVLSPIVKMIQDGYDLYLGSFNGNAFDIPALARCFEYAIEEAKKRLDPIVNKYEEDFSKFCEYFNISTEQFEVGGQTRTRYIMKEDIHSIDAFTIIGNMFPGKFYRQGRESNTRSLTLRDTVAALGILGTNTHLGKDDTNATRRLMQYLASYNQEGAYVPMDEAENTPQIREILKELLRLGTSERGIANAAVSYVIAELEGLTPEEGAVDWHTQVNKGIVDSIESQLSGTPATEEYKTLLRWFIVNSFAQGLNPIEFLKDWEVTGVTMDISRGPGYGKLLLNRENFVNKVKELVRQMREATEQNNFCN